MKCSTKREAARIAYFGAIKMDGQGYRYEVIRAWETENGQGEATKLPQLRNGGYAVTNAEGRTYHVYDSPFAEQTRELECQCGFWRENREFGVCKHTTRIEWLLKDAEEQSQRDAEEDAWADEALARMEALEGLEGDALTRSYARA